MKMNRIVAVLVAALMLLTGVAAMAQGTVTVQGVGSVKVNSDRAGISLGVREVDAEVLMAQTKVNEKIDAIVAAMKAMGVTDDAISTNGIGIYPNYNYDEGEQIVDYTAYNTLYVTVTDMDNIGAYIDAAFAVGANSLDYVDFSAAETDEAAEQALRLAVESAKAKAQVIADAAGVKLGDILEIHDVSETGVVGNDFYTRNAVAEGDGAGTGVMASMQTVSAVVSITFSLAEAE